MRKNLENAWMQCRLVVKSGVLSSKKKFAHSDTRQKDGTEQISEVSFPHKLMQEYMAGYYLASLYREKPTEFDKLLKDKNVLDKYEEFRYLLYFTAALWKRAEQADRHLMHSLCEALGTDLEPSTDNPRILYYRENVVNPCVDFLVDVAFEMS